MWKVKDSFQDNKIYDKAVVLSGGVDHRWYPQDKQRKNTVDTEEYFIFNATEMELHMLNYAVAYLNPSWDNRRAICRFSIADLIKNRLQQILGNRKHSFKSSLDNSMVDGNCKFNHQSIHSL